MSPAPVSSTQPMDGSSRIRANASISSRDGLRPERVADLRAVDRDLGDARPGVLVADVVVLGDRGSRSRDGHAASSCRKSRARRRKATGRLVVRRVAGAVDDRRAGRRGCRRRPASARGRPRSSRAPAMTSVGAPDLREAVVRVAPWCPGRRRAGSRRGRPAGWRAGSPRMRAARAGGSAAWAREDRLVPPTRRRTARSRRARSARRRASSAARRAVAARHGSRCRPTDSRGRGGRTTSGWAIARRSAIRAPSE